MILLSPDWTNAGLTPTLLHDLTNPAFQRYLGLVNSMFPLACLPHLSLSQLSPHFLHLSSILVACQHSDEVADYLFTPALFPDSCCCLGRISADIPVIICTSRCYAIHPHSSTVGGPQNHLFIFAICCHRTFCFPRFVIFSINARETIPKISLYTHRDVQNAASYRNKIIHNAQPSGPTHNN